jgi:FKBP-type peptidyl-prolyl cis-trans isomerase
MNRSREARGVLLTAFLAAALLAGCKHIGFEDQPMPVHRGSSTTTSGLVLEDLFVGHGPEARTGDDVTFEYTVWLQDGTRVDSTYDRGVALTVRLGSAPIRAWDEGLVGVRAQGRRRLVIPPDLAYGAKGVEGRIPPNATIVAEILALEIAPPDAAAKPSASAKHPTP